MATAGAQTGTTENYLRPRRLDDALAALAAAPRQIVAGGTDFYPARVGRPLDGAVLDVTALDDLEGIRDLGERHRIGARVTWSELLRSPLPAWFDGLKLAAREVGGVQIQNAGTICGNVCNASPAADGVPCLLALDAVVEIASVRGIRAVALGDFIVGNRRTALAADELVTGLSIPKAGAGARSTFLKLGARRYLVISIAMVAALIEPDGEGRVARAHLAVGACSPVPCRLPALEDALVGRPLNAALAEVAGAAHLGPLAPIDDVRGTAAYRREAALTLIRRALTDLAARFEADRG